MKRISISVLWMFSLMFCFYVGSTFASGIDIDRMSKEQLQAKLADSNVIVVDARSGRDWKSSEFKIKGAVRPGKDIVKWAESYGKDKTFVLYCA